MAIAGGLLYYFFRSTPLCDRYTAIEGLQRSEPKSGKWGILIVTFLLTALYLPLSTMAVHVIVWSDDLWVVPNYYTNATSFPPTVDPLGPPSEFRDPLDFCWTTTMKKNEINYAPVVIIMSVIVVASVRHSLCDVIMINVLILEVADGLVSLGAPEGHSALCSEGGYVYRPWSPQKRRRHGSRIPPPALA